jgi:hypothetical protein
VQKAIFWTFFTKNKEFLSPRCGAIRLKSSLTRRKARFFMKKMLKSLGFAVLIMAIAFNYMLIIGCAENTKNDSSPNDSSSNNHGWNVWKASSSTATLDYSISDDGVCTVTVGGTPEKHEDGAWNGWKVSADYSYTGIANKMYEYKFEAWTSSGTRNLRMHYYKDNDDSIYLENTIPITKTRKTYTVRGVALPKGGKLIASFLLADQLGTVNIKMLDIKEFVIGKLTITNFLSISDLSQNNYIRGYAMNSDSTLGFGVKMHTWENSSYYSEGIQIIGNTITIPVWEVIYSEPCTFIPFLGDITIEAGRLELEPYKILPDSNWDYLNYYINTVPITFTNGNATINFATQMELVGRDSEYPVEP